MIYKSVSAKQVIAMIMKTTKLDDLTYADDIWDWLTEATKDLVKRTQMLPTHKFLEVKDFSTELPCDISQLDAVVYNGCRLRLGLGVNDTKVKVLDKSDESKTSIYFSDTDDPAYKNQQDYLLVRGQDIKVSGLPLSSVDYYVPTLDFLQLSFCEGCILILYRSRPLDKDGFPLIPDEFHCRQACFWYIMGRLALSGYKHNDPRMDYEYCEGKYEREAKRARGKMRYWSVDKREAVLQATVNLLPPQGYYESFMIGAEQPKYLNK